MNSSLTKQSIWSAVVPEFLIDLPPFAAYIKAARNDWNWNKMETSFFEVYEALQ